MSIPSELRPRRPANGAGYCISSIVAFAHRLGAPDSASGERSQSAAEDHLECRAIKASSVPLTVLRRVTQVVRTPYSQVLPLVVSLGVREISYQVNRLRKVNGLSCKLSARQ